MDRGSQERPDPERDRRGQTAQAGLSDACPDRVSVSEAADRQTDAEERDTCTRNAQRESGGAAAEDQERQQRYDRARGEGLERAQPGGYR